MSLTLPARAELAPGDTWALEHLFATPDDAEAALRDGEQRVAALSARAGNLAADATSLLDALDALEGFVRASTRLGNYFRLPVTTDQLDPHARAMDGRFQAIAARWGRALAFIEPELLAAPPERLAGFVAQEPRLARFRPYLERLELRRPHVRSPEVEDVLAGAAGVFDAYERSRDALAEGDLSFGAVAVDGGARELAPSSYRGLVHDPDRGVRRQAFERWTDGYLSVADTLAETYLARVRRSAFEAEVRGHASSEALALTRHRVTTGVLDATLAAFQRRLPVWHRYWAARRRLLGVERHQPWDVFAPPPTAGVRVPYEQAAAWIVESAAPLGAEYAGLLRRGMLEERWVDRRPNRGKRQGAFCADAPDVHPYVFVSYTDDLVSASTLAHEMGHAMHAVWAEAAVPALDGVTALSMTVAETASNGQQALLRGALMRHPRAAEPDFELALIDEAFGNLHRYLFVMPTLVRFEREVHAAVGRGEALAARDLTLTAARLFGEAYGPEVTDGWDAEMTSRVGIAWAEFPHLYEPFYTFQYTVGVAVALAQVARIDDGAVGAVEAYLDFLSAGGSVPPLELFARIGFDVTTPAPVEAAFDVVEGLVARLEAHAERMGR
jgi:oligoendopeptidase F